MAGLGPTDVSNALQNATGLEGVKQQAETARQQTVAGLLEKLYKPQDSQDKTYPMLGPSGEPMTYREWNALPTKEKEYASYVDSAKKIGAPKEELTRSFFNSLAPTDREKFIKSALENPDIMKGAKELAEAGRTTISIGDKVAEKVAEKKALGDLGGQLYFSSPKWIDDTNKYINSDNIQREIFMESQKKGGDPGLLKAKEAVKYIEGKISAGGTIKDVKLSKDGKTMTWTVKWKSGDVGDISYDIRP